MQSSVKRAAAFALIATVSLLAPIAGPLVAVPFALVAVAGRTITGGRFFELFARPGDRQEGKLRGLVGFSLAATALALLTAFGDLPSGVFVAAVLLVGYGNLIERVLCGVEDSDIRRVVAFTLGGIPAAFGGQATVALIDGTSVNAPTAAFMAITGALVGALVRRARVTDDDPLVMISVGIVLWTFAVLDLGVDPVGLGIAIGIAGAFGYLSWLLQTASIQGMLTGVIITLLTIVLGGYGWFAILISFFGVGSLSSKFRYEEKRELGAEEANEGERGTGNVLGNAAVALVAVVGYAGGESLALPPEAFLFAFAGSIATAMSDTLSSEIGVLFGPPRLITTLEPVKPGTDGGVTIRGCLIGAGGAAVVAVIGFLAFDLGPSGIGLLVLAGTLGMFVDSVLGATLEGRWIGNQSVNFLATLAGALIAGGGAIWLGLP